MIVKVRVSAETFAKLSSFLETSANRYQHETREASLLGERYPAHNIEHIAQVKDLKGANDTTPCGSIDVTLEIAESCRGCKKKVSLSQVTKIIGVLGTFEK